MCRKEGREGKKRDKQLRNYNLSCCLSGAISSSRNLTSIRGLQHIHLCTSVLANAREGGVHKKVPRQVQPNLSPPQWTLAATNLVTPWPRPALHSQDWTAVSVRAGCIGALRTLSLVLGKPMESHSSTSCLAIALKAHLAGRGGGGCHFYS